MENQNPVQAQNQPLAPVQPQPIIEPQSVKKPLLSKSIITAFIIGIILILLPAGTYLFLNSNKQVACTTEAKICSDGSSVGRTGPKCEFQTCPKTKPSPSPIPNPTPTCKPRPACLDATPRCLIPETSDMCPKTNTTTATPDPASNAADATANWKTYTNSDFSVKYPVSWIVKVDSGSQVTSIYDPSHMKTSVRNGGNTFSSPTEYFNINRITTTSQSVKAYADIATSGPEYTGIQTNRKTISVNGLSAEIYIAAGEGSQGYDIALSNGTKLIVINIPAANPSLDSTINQILSTFKFTQ